MDKKPNVVIKAAKAGDWKVIQKLNIQVFESDKGNDDDLDVDWPFSMEGILYYKNLVSRKSGRCFIAYVEDKPVGYIALSPKDFGYRKSKYIEVENMGVEPKYRSKGIGSMLIDEASRWARSKGAAKLFVSAYWGNKKAVKFYKRNGFYESGIEMDNKL